MNKTADEILNGPDYFRCERFKLRMKKSLCVDWQNGKSAAFAKDYSIVECARCKQGEKIKQEIYISKAKEDIIMNTTNQNDVVLCKDGCGKPAMLNRNGKIINGRCSHCHSRIMSDARKKGRKKEKNKIETISLDLTGVMEEYPILMESLTAAAKRDMRPVEMEAAFLIHEGLKNSEGNV